MRPIKFLTYSIISLCFLLAACDTTPTPAQTAASTPPLLPTDTPIPTPEPTNPPEPAAVTEAPAEPTATVESAPAPESPATPAPVVEVDWLSVEGKTDQGYAYRGNPDAPITITDFSDFL